MSTETKAVHTPGPWQQEQSWGTRSQIVAEVVRHTKPRREYICRTNRTTDIFEEAANARLIAAAPDLLTESKAVIAEFFEEYEREDYYPESSPTCQAIKRLQAAIRKAEGR